MSQTLEILMYQTGQVFPIPTLIAIALLFLYAFYALRLRRPVVAAAARSHLLRRSVRLSARRLGAHAALAESDAAHDHAQAAAPAVPDYSLVLPCNLRHLIQFIGKIGLSETGKSALDGQTKVQLAPRLDRLQQVRRRAAEIHIDCVNRVKAAVGADRYARLIELSLPPGAAGR